VVTNVRGVAVSGPVAQAPAKASGLDGSIEMVMAGVVEKGAARMFAGLPRAFLSPRFPCTTGVSES
jgi:hypothetical protein